MTNAYLEYLTSNENIAYPFKSDSSSLDYGREDLPSGTRNFTVSKLPTDYISDLTFFIVGDDTSITFERIYVTAGVLYFSIKVGATSYQIEMGSPSITWQLHTTIQTILEGVFHFTLVVGPSYKEYNMFVATNETTDTLNLELEPSLIEKRLNRVESLQIHDPDFIDPTKATGYMDGYESIPREIAVSNAMLGYPSFIKEYYTDPMKDMPVVLVPGYNIRLLQDVNEITVDCSPGLGAGRYPCAAQIDDMLAPEIIAPTGARTILTINKLEAKNGRFLLRWDDCYRIVPEAETNTLYVYGDCKPCCDCVDYIAVGEVIQQLADKYIVPISTKVKAFTSNNPEKLVDGVLAPEVYDSVIWDSYKFEDGTSKAVSTTLVDTDKNWKENGLVGKTITRLLRSGDTAILLSKIASNTSTTITTVTPISWTLTDNYKIQDSIGCGISTNPAIDSILQDSTQSWGVNKLVGKTLLRTGPSGGQLSYIISNTVNTVYTHDPIMWNAGDTYEIRDRTWGYSPLVRMWNIEIIPNLKSVNFDIKLIGGMASAAASEKAVQSSTVARMYSTIKNFVIAKPESDANLFPVWTWVDFKDICNLRNDLFYREGATKVVVKDEYLEETTNFLQDGSDDVFGFNTLERNAGATRTSLLHRVYPSSQFLDRLKGHFVNELGYKQTLDPSNILYTGTHTNTGSYTSKLEDLTKSWDIDSLIGCIVKSEYTGETGIIVDNGTSTVLNANSILWMYGHGYTIYKGEYQSILDVCTYLGADRVTPDRLLITRLLSELKGLMVTINPSHLNSGWVISPLSYFMIGPYRVSTKDAGGYLEKYWYVDTYDSATGTYIEQVYYTSISQVKFDATVGFGSIAAQKLVQALKFIGYPAVYFVRNQLLIRNIKTLQVVTQITVTINGILTVVPNPEYNFVDVSTPLLPIYNKTKELFKQLNGEMNREWRTKMGFVALNNKAARNGMLDGKPILGFNCETGYAPVDWAKTPEDILSVTYKGTATFTTWTNGPVFTKQDRNGIYLSLHLVSDYEDDLHNKKVRWVISDVTNGVLYYHDLGVDSYDEVTYAPWDTRWTVSGSEDNSSIKSFTTLVGRWRDAKTHAIVPELIIIPLNGSFARPKWDPVALTYTPSVDYLSFMEEINSELGNIIL